MLTIDDESAPTLSEDERLRTRGGVKCNFIGESGRCVSLWIRFNLHLIHPRCTAVGIRMYAVEIAASCRHYRNRIATVLQEAHPRATRNVRRVRICRFRCRAKVRRRDRFLREAIRRFPSTE